MSEKKRILFVGEHPYGPSGNSHMMRAVLSQVDRDLYDIACYSETFLPVLLDPFSNFDYTITTPDDISDQYGCAKLVKLLEVMQFDAMITVGVDLWHYQAIIHLIRDLRNKRKFKWGAIFPYDLHIIRSDWIEWIKWLDYAGVYSIYGFDLLRAHIPNIHYFRPPMQDWQKYYPCSEEERKVLKNKHFSGHADDKFLFGFIGINQLRKDPQRVIKAFFEVKQQIPNVSLYMHTNLGSGIFNIPQFIDDCGGDRGDILVKNQSIIYTDDQMAEVYNAIDCLVNASFQEGLSWTILQSMLCKTPVIGAYNTAQKELLDYGAVCSVPSTETTFLPIVGGTGPTQVETKACDFTRLVGGMISAATGCYEHSLVDRAYENARSWVETPSNINELLEVVTRPEPLNVREKKIQKVLFVQHSSAGDVFMTTRCFKGLKERHPGMPLVYMTQPQFQNIVEGNPYVEEILDWDLSVADKYVYVYNPHGDRIAPGHWGRNCNSILSDFYWKILRVTPDDFFIGLKQPDCIVKNGDYYTYNEPGIVTDYAHLAWPSDTPILVVHTTGGNAYFRTYKYMRDVCEAVKNKYLTIQVGAGSDYPGWAKIDLRGKLTYQETAWVLSKARLAVTVDSFISHLAGALGVSQVCLFGSGNYAVVRPNQMAGKLICMSPDYINHCKGLGPCSGCVLDCPVPCTSIHDPKEIIAQLDALERFIQVKALEDGMARNRTAISLGEK